MRQPKRFFETGRVLALGCLVLVAGRVSADESPWFGEAAFGLSDAESRFGSTRSKLIDDQSQAAEVALGYAFNRYLAIQAGYHDLGSHRGFGSPCPRGADRCVERLATLGLCVEGSDCTAALVDVEADISGLSLAAVPRWPVTERFSVRGKVGVISWDGEVSASPGGARIESYSGEDLLIGVGLQFDFPSGFGLLLQHDELDLDVSTTVLGVSWRF